MNNENDDTEGHSITDVEFMPVVPTNPYLSVSQPCVNVWKEKLSKGILTNTHFKEHWRIWVPKIYKLQPTDNCLEWQFNEDQASKILYGPLEEFILGGEPSEVLKQLSQNDKPPSVCGRVFKNGEPTYSCRECGVDATCVLCVDCFKQSIHKNHKYKMGISVGGGCCDCGDTEAWRNGPYCDIHHAGIELKDVPPKTLPTEMQERAATTFTAVLRYCYDLLSMEHSPSLPADLCVKNTDEDSVSFQASNDTYCTVLFNDESHTFDQVIVTLTRVIKCSQRDAIEYVTNIDREGRAVVKCSGFQHCQDLKVEIERFTNRHSNRPLKVLVEHSHVIAHQIFAMKLLSWLQHFISHGEGFRRIFTDVALDAKSPDIPIAKGIMVRDWQLWKAARAAWHRLFIAGMLTEYESKKKLSIMFTSNYGTVLKDFIGDDHDHSYSIASLAVQLFTVPTLAYHLIAHHEALFVLLNTFLSESQRKCNANGKLEFERNTPNNSFKRAQYILYDLRYLLSSKPDTWCDELRRGFLLGMSLLLQLFSSMQMMDAVVRQVGQHMEYEQEWESAFNLYIKLSPVISLTIEWCSTDKLVMIKTLRLLLKKIKDMSHVAVITAKRVAHREATCIMYDVASEPVSIHLPLSRLLAGLLLHVEKFGLSLSSSEFEIAPRLGVEEIIEPVLRAQVMISQVHAGMWRRNGYSLIHQLYFYHNVKCRTEMLDRDIVLLQFGAVAIESNEFIIHVLNKYNLVNWAQPEFEEKLPDSNDDDTIRQTIILIEEFLGLMITIIAERYVPGVGRVTTDDCMKREIIQHLCIKPLSHSEIHKVLPDDIHYETGMERVINDIADFKKPQSSGGKGVYELKPEFYETYDVFFYHYTKEELSKSEEIQRKRRKNAGQLECCPPPQLLHLTEMFTPIVNLLQCDVMLSLMRLILLRALDFKARSFSEPQVHKILHLIGYALQEQETGRYPFFNFTEKAEAQEIFKLLESLKSSVRIDAHKDLLLWVLEKYRKMSGSPDMKKEPETPVSPKLEGEDADAKVEKGSQEWRNKMAAKKRAQIMAQMQAAQKMFMQQNAQIFEEAALLDTSNKSLQGHGSAMDLSENLDDTYVALGPRQSTRSTQERTFTCILCQEDQPITLAHGSAIVRAAFVQQSSVLFQNPQTPTISATATAPSTYQEPTALFLSSRLGPSPHTSTCGHTMHVVCWQKYFDNVMAKENRRPYRLRQPNSFDIEKSEYLCPLCECLSNTILPVLPTLAIIQPTVQSQREISFDRWLEIMQAVAKCRGIRDTAPMECDVHDPECRYCRYLAQGLPITDDGDANSLKTEAPKPAQIRSCPIEVCKSFEEGDELLRLYSQYGPVLSEQLVNMIGLYVQTTFTKGLSLNFNAVDTRVPLLAWKSTAYTVHALEFLLRETKKPLLGSLSSRQHDTLECLARVSSVLGSTWLTPSIHADCISEDALRILSLLLNNAESDYSILNWDSFGLLVTLISTLSSLLSTLKDGRFSCVSGHVGDWHTVRLVFIAHIVKILLTLNLDEDVPMDTENDDEEIIMDVEEKAAESLLPLMERLNLSCGRFTVGQVWKRVKQACAPFLRCCTLYFHFVTDVAVPTELTMMHGDTYENMCRYLGMPETCNELLDSQVVRDLAASWIQHPALSEDKINCVKEPLKINRFVDLPEDYSELMNTVSMFTCPNSDKEDSRNPTMCLVCGAMLCSQSYCCQIELNKVNVGACIHHAHTCGAGVGVFLRVRDCEIVYLRSPNRGAYQCPPYYDEYGEPDQGLHRGNPLKLCREKYQILHQTWLSHGVYEEIARHVDAQSQTASGSWQHL
ncbi:E3 ubiquitin-protein ligase UBR2 [Trichogramma pretiosum]|uniref:E3 ubiquitin-protein ligase UBR2 n=1 Tax=Trichogramma pretiosum TaxID=7493 RepID=UPI0006C9A2DB|nr:E3 ubiquitin-protein ligase UBR2 [Trichogramma pretiosum]XP_014224488.1 E3 ubiquitin-protein ligase UBR2 [Trichogramma pretiosum]